MSKINFFVYRNYTVEHLFKNLNYSFSDYDSVNIDNIVSKNLIWFYQINPLETSELVLDKLKSYEKLLNLIIEKTKFEMLLLFPISLYDSLEIIEEKNIELINSINKYNQYLINLQNKDSRIYYIDIQEFENDNVQLFDFKYFVFSKAIISPKFSENFKDWYLSKLKNLNLKKYKCIVLDLDNTIWHGIVGEDGPSGIKFNGDIPGAFFEIFQLFIKMLKNNGVILAIASKNNIEDVEQVWNERRDIVLKKSDFSDIMINWKNKADNILAISKNLNIGLESIVFIDDNDSEIELVNKFRPDVTTLKFPNNPENVYDFIKGIIPMFKKYTLTEEDSKRTVYYSQKKIREEEQLNFKDIDSYIKSLNIKIDINKICNTSSERVFQLLNKTNQFNLTTNRYDKIKFEKKKLSSKIFHITVSDKFGNSGITGVAITKIKDRTVEITDFLLSCRILGKKIEDDFIKFLINYYSKNNYKIMTATYIKSVKNIQTKSFFKNNFFTEIKKLDDRICYELKLNEEMKLNYFNKVSIAFKD